jgi:hypothetical protein
MLGDGDSELLNRTLPGATVGSIASIYAHVVFAEDAFVQARFQSKPTVY